MNEKIKKLEEYFEKREDTEMAFLFGSRAEKNRINEHSDWDIAVYLKSKDKKLERQSDANYTTQEEEIWNSLSNLLQTDNIDLIVLNRAYPTVADSALRGAPLVIKNRLLWLKFMLKITSEAIDFRKTAHEYYQIFMRSHSLNAQDAHELERIIEFLKSEIKFLADFKNILWVDYQEDRLRRNAMERSIEKLMNAIIDTAKIVLSSKHKPMPMSYREIIETVSIDSAFSKEIIERLSKWAELRNILAHEYLDLRWNKIHDFLQNADTIFNSFIESAKKFLEENREKENK